MYDIEPQDRLTDMFKLQRDFQIMLGVDPTTLLESPREELIQWFKDQIMALQSEIQEALDEVGWKPWATSAHFNDKAVRAELIDAWHFFMNLCMVSGMSPHDLHEGYLKKLQKNIDRQENGYDGVSTKCPKCKRALDDWAVTCHLPGDGTEHAKGRGFCMVSEGYYE